MGLASLVLGIGAVAPLAPAALLFVFLALVYPACVAALVFLAATVPWTMVLARRPWLWKLVLPVEAATALLLPLAPAVALGLLPVVSLAAQAVAVLVLWTALVAAGTLAFGVGLLATIPLALALTPVVVAGCTAATLGAAVAVPLVAGACWYLVGPAVLLAVWAARGSSPRLSSTYTFVRASGLRAKLTGWLPAGLVEAAEGRIAGFVHTCQRAVVDDACWIR